MYLHNNADTCDPWRVEQLVKAATMAMEKASTLDTTPSEVLSASFTFLERTLMAMRKLQGEENAAFNAKEISNVLNGFIIEYGRLPN